MSEPDPVGDVEGAIERVRRARAEVRRRRRPSDPSPFPRLSLFGRKRKRGRK